MSADGEGIKRLMPKFPLNTLESWLLSVTSTRLLVTSLDTNQLIQFDAGGDELRRIQVPDDVMPEHAVESATGTFIISHRNTKLKHYQISEVNTDGRVLRQFVGSRLPSLGWPQHIAVDSQVNIFVADYQSRHILLLDAQLKLRRFIIDERQLNYELPRRLCYRERTGQLLVGLADSVAVFDVARR